MTAPKSHVKVSGIWKEAKKIYVKVSGTWKDVNKAYVRQSGVWKQTFTRTQFSYQTSAYSDPAAAAITFSSLSFGAADPTRKILIGVTCRDNSSSDVVSVSIGGVGATEVLKVRNVSGGYLSIAAFYIADVPNGTTGDVYIDWSATPFYHGCHVWSLYGLETNTPTSTATDTNGGSPMAVNLTTQTGDWLFGVAYSQSSTADNITWSGLTKHSQPHGTTCGASYTATSSESPRAISASCASTSSYNAAASCSFRP